MPNFKFKLESVLLLRERERDRAAQDLQQAWMAMEKIDQQIEELRHTHDAQLPVQVESSGNLINPQKLLESQRYQMHLLQEIKNLRADKARIEAEHEKRRKVLVEKEKKVRSIEKLKLRQRTLHELELLKKEQDTLDQWAGFNYWKSATADQGE